MPNTPMTKNQGAGVVKLMLIGMVCFLALLAYVFAQSYIGRQNLKHAEQRARVAMIQFQRAGCERSKKDRNANAKGWRTAEKARLRSLSDQINISYTTAQSLVSQNPAPDDPPDLEAAREYDKIASELEGRSRIDCAEAYPLVGV